MLKGLFRYLRKKRKNVIDPSTVSPIPGLTQLGVIGPESICSQVAIRKKIEAQKEARRVERGQANGGVSGGASGSALDRFRR